MAIEATAAHGCVIKIGNGASSETFTEIDGVHNGPSGPGWDTQMIEGRHHGSVNPTKKATYVNISPVTFSIFYDSTDTQHQLLLTNAAAKTRTNFQMILTDEGDEQYAFAAYIGMSVKAGVEEFNVMDVSLNIDGTVTVS